MSGPRISVIIPTYNRAKSVVEAVASVLMQDPLPFEVIVVDDGSTDDTQSVLAGLSDRIRVVSKENGGAASARNRGIAEAKGEWLAFLDSDDLWFAGRIAVFLRDLPSAPEDCVAHVANIRFDPSGRDLFSSNGASFPKGSAAVIEQPFDAKIPGPYVQASVLRAESVRELGGFDETLPIHEDILLLRRLALAGPWLVTGDQIGSYRRVEGDEIALMDWETRHPIRFFQSRVRLNAALLEDERLIGRSREAVSRDLSGAQFLLAGAYSADGQKSQARAALAESVRSHLSFKTALRAIIPMVLGQSGYGAALNGQDLSLRPDNVARTRSRKEGV